MANLGPGVHPSFDIGRFDVPEQRVLRRLSRLFHLTRSGRITLGNQGSTYNYALVKPVGSMRGIMHTEREVMVLFSNYSNFQPRTLDAFDYIIEEISEKFRVEKVARILISSDQAVSIKLKDIFRGKPDAPVVIPFAADDISSNSSDESIIKIIRDFTFSRDLFSISSPLKSDLYFFGRSNLINEICSKLASGENYGLFGLRRSGKTSLVAGVSRALSARNCASLTIDCQSPSNHQIRWNELLKSIATQLKEKYSVSIVNSKDELYSEKNAAATFLKDILVIKKKMRVDFIAFLFDEIERISLTTGSSDHWASGRDFLLFWQSIRSGFQSDGSPFTFLIVGTNPTCIETAMIGQNDNPLFGNVQKRYIPMFSPKQTSEMVNSLGAVMGVTFDDECITKLNQDFGGHPFLIRQACSAIARKVEDRPVIVDRTLYAIGLNEFSGEADAYVESVVELLKSQYEDEHEMLSLLGLKDTDAFQSYAEQDRLLVDHLIGYGLLTKGAKSYYFNIGIVEGYFSKKKSPIHIMNMASRLAEISKRRNELERSIRSHIMNVSKVSYPSKNRKNEILSKLKSERRDALMSHELEFILSPGESPLFFDELKSIIMGKWEDFANSIEIQKSEFELYMNTVNRYRSDAHSKDISDNDFDKIRVALNELEQVFA